MQEIGDHLGHRSPNTTAGYAKINETTNEERLPVTLGYRILLIIPASTVSLPAVAAGAQRGGVSDLLSFTNRLW